MKTVNPHHCQGLDSLREPEGAADRPNFEWQCLISRGTFSKAVEDLDVHVRLIYQMVVTTGVWQLQSHGQAVLRNAGYI